MGYLYEDPRNANVILIPGLTIGRDHPLVLMAGPCAAEDEKQVKDSAAAARAAGAVVLRGGAFKPRTNPYSFRGLGESGITMLREAADESGLLLVSEVLSEHHVELVANHAHVVQVGSRNMDNTALLAALSRCGRPVLLKRGYGSSVKEWLLAAEYILQGGWPNVILCERGVNAGVSNNDPMATRYVADVGGLASVRERSTLPVIGDPSHPAGRGSLVGPIARAYVAAGADGLIVETHPDATAAKCDGDQALSPEALLRLGREAEAVASALGRGFAQQ